MNKLLRVVVLVLIMANIIKNVKAQADISVKEVEMTQDNTLFGDCKLSTSSLPKGHYIVKIFYDNEVQVRNFTKI